MHRAIPPDPHTIAQAGPPVSGEEAVGDLHLAGDNFAGAIEAYRHALTSLSATDAAGRGRLQLRIAEACSRRGDADGAWEAVREARSVTRALDDSRMRARIAVRAAAVFYDRGRYRRSARYARFAFASLRGTEDHSSVARASELLGMNELRFGRPRAAIEWLQNASATYRRIDDANGLVSALNNLGLIHKNLREWRGGHALPRAGARDRRAQGLLRAHPVELPESRADPSAPRPLGGGRGELRVVAAHLARARLRTWRGERADGARHAGPPPPRIRSCEATFTRRRWASRPAPAPRDIQLASEFLAELDLDRGLGGRGARAHRTGARRGARARPGRRNGGRAQIRAGLARLLAPDLEGAARDLASGRALAIAARRSHRAGDCAARTVPARGPPPATPPRSNRNWARLRIRSSRSGETFELATTLAAWAEHLRLLPASQRLRQPLAPVTEWARRAAALFRGLGVASLAAEALLAVVWLEPSANSSTRPCRCSRRPKCCSRARAAKRASARGTFGARSSGSTSRCRYRLVMSSARSRRRTSCFAARPTWTGCSRRW